MKTDIQPLAFALFGVTGSIFASVGVENDIPLVSESIDFIYSALFWLGLGLLLVLWMILVEHCDGLSDKWPIKCLVVKNYKQELIAIASALIPIIVGLLLSSANAMEPKPAWVFELQNVAYCFLAPIAFILLFKVHSSIRSARKDPQSLNLEGGTSTEQEIPD